MIYRFSETDYLFIALLKVILCILSLKRRTSLFPNFGSSGLL